MVHTEKRKAYILIDISGNWIKVVEEYEHD